MIVWGRLSIPGEPFAIYTMMATAFVLLVVLVRIAWRRPDRRWRRTRILATSLAIVSLLLIGLRPHWPSSASGIAQALLVTEGAMPDDLQVLADSLGSTLPVFSLIDLAPWSERFDNVIRIPDAAYLARHYGDLTRLAVAGYGLDAFDWDALPHVGVTSHVPPESPGFEAIHWPPEIVLGQRLAIEGRLSGMAEGWLYLEGPGGVVDSLAVDGTTRFTLQTKPRTVGQIAYTLRVEAASGETIPIETIWVSVTPPPRFSVLILETSPRFETRHFKAWHTGQGGALAIRSTISADRFRYDFSNLPEFDLSRISPAVLSDFDVLFIDLPALRSLNVAERSAVRSSVRDTGLGVLLSSDVLRPDAPSLPTSDAVFFQPDRLVASPVSEPRMVHPRWPDRPVDLAAALPAAPFFIKEGTYEQVLMEDDDAQPLAVSWDRGRGRIGVSLVEETFRWILQGHPDMYASYWSHMLSSLARPAEGSQWHWPREAPLHVDQPVPLSLTTDLSSPRAFVESPDGRSISLPLRQDPIMSWRWTTTYWPDGPGWHRLVAGDRSAWIYVYPDTAWTSVQHASRVLATARRAGSSPVFESPLSVAQPVVNRPISRLSFFFLFLISSAFLWAERKF